MVAYLVLEDQIDYRDHDDNRLFHGTLQDWLTRQGWL